MSLTTLLGDIFGRAEVVPNKHPVKQEVKRVKEPLCIGHIKGHTDVKIGLLVAAAGRHNVLLVGPPGEGKSSIAGTLPGFLPRQTKGELDELRWIRSNCIDCLNSSHSSSRQSYRPFVEVGPNITESGLLGGGRKPSPGAISLAHSGVLFMDEFPQYDRQLLESLRNPLESREILISRNSEQRLYPCNFQLVSAMNPCPCGYGGDRCRCTPTQVHRYQSRLSGPIIDRIDIFLYMDRINAVTKFEPYIENQSDDFRVKVENAVLFRLNDRGQEYANKDIHSKEVFNTASDILRWNSCGLKSFKMYLDRDSFTTRKGVRLARLGRTMADLLGHSKIESKHLYMIDQFLFLPGALAM